MNNHPRHTLAMRVTTGLTLFVVTNLVLGFWTFVRAGQAPTLPVIEASKQLRGSPLRNDKAAAFYEQALEKSRGWESNANVRLAIALRHLGLTHVAYSRYAAAEPLLREALVLRKRVHTNSHPEITAALENLAFVQRKNGSLADAEKHLREAVELGRSLDEDVDGRLVRSLSNLGATLLERNALTEAEGFLREALAGAKPSNPNVEYANANMAMLLGRQEKYAEAEGFYREALAIAYRRSDDQQHIQSRTIALATCLRDQKKYAESERHYRDALDMARRLVLKYPTPQSRYAREQLEARINDVAALLELRGTAQDRQEFYRGLLVPARESDPQYTGILQARGCVLARRGDWKGATADLTKAIAVEPNHFPHYYYLAPLLAARGEREDYNRVREQMLKRFSRTTNSMQARQLLKVCALGPLSGINPDIVDRLGRTASRDQTNEDIICWAQFARALADYQRARFDAAIEWAEKAVRKSEPAAGYSLDAGAYLVLAMAHYQLEHHAEAEAALDQGLEIAEKKLPQINRGDLGKGWVECLVVHSLLREATVMTATLRRTSRRYR